MTKHIHQSASEFNNTGLVLLRNGDYDGALDHLRHALQVVKQKLRGCRQTSNSKHRRSSFVPQVSEFCIDRFDEGFRLQLAQDQLMGRSDECQDGSSTSFTTPFVHSNGIPIPHSSATGGCCFSSDTFQDHKICSAIVIFNIGVVLQNQGMQRSRQPESLKNFQKSKAMALYQQAHKLLQHSIDAGRPVGIPAIDMLYMALLNNIAVLYSNSCYSNSDVLRAHLYFGRLADFCRSLVTQQHYHSPNIATLMSHHANHFLRHAETKLLQPFVAAAAA